MFQGSGTQPVTSAPRLAPSSAGGYLVEFGTGELFQVGDDTTTTLQFIYVVRDDPANLMPITRSTLVADQLLALGNGSFTAAPTAPINWSVDRGWYLDLTAAGVASGERILNTATTVGTTFIASSYVPNPGGSNLCVPSATSFIYQIDYATGAGQAVQTSGSVGGYLLLDVVGAALPAPPLMGTTANSPGGGPAWRS